MKPLLTFSGLTHDPQGVLTAVQPLALVFGKLLTETFLRVGGSLERVQRDFEVLGAMGTNANGGNGSEPLDYPKVALCHAVSVPQECAAWLSPVEIKRHHYPLFACELMDSAWATTDFLPLGTATPEVENSGPESPVCGPPSVITSKAANSYHFKTGQRNTPGT